VGEGPERAALERRARDHGILGAVRFAGAAPDVPAWLGAADAFVLPSRVEGLSVALLEAMAAGVPVVATDVGGTRDAAGGAAVLVPAAHPLALADALAAILAEPDRARTLAEAGRRRVLSRYGIQLVARRHLDLYREVAEARRATGGGHVVWAAADRIRALVVPGDHRDVHPRRAP
jgi:glycosyltransferase involved in cell wall biosynthesis